MESRPPHSATQIRFLITSLVFIFILILTLVVLILAYPVLFAPPPSPSPSLTLTATITPTITQTPTITLTPSFSTTPRPTFTPSKTPTPSRTGPPSRTPTPTGPATLTPAAPLGGESNFILKDWDADQAASLVEMLQYYPITLSEEERGSNDENFKAAFTYAVLAEEEAIYRFPDSRYSDHWRWWRAVNLLRMGSDNSPQQLAQAIADSLNRGQASLSDFSAYVEQVLPGVQSHLVTLKPSPGSLHRYLLQLSGEVKEYFLIVETQSAMAVYPLVSQFIYPTPAATPLPATPTALDPAVSGDNLFLADLTGDGYEEVVIYPAEPETNLTLALPEVFNLRELPPQELPFDPITSVFGIGMSYDNHWDVNQTLQGTNQLLFSTHLFPTCPVDIRKIYQWDGTLFEPVETDYAIEPYSQTLSYCRYIASHAASTWGAQAAIDVMTPLLPEWPPERDENGKRFAPEAKDEWRYLLGIYYAELGNFEKSQSILQGLISSPATPTSVWISPAQTFLQLYKSRQDLYRACAAARACDPAFAIQNMIATFTSQQASDVVPYLYQIGVIQRASGYFDFDGDGSLDIWFTVQNRAGESLQFWALVPYGNHLAAIQVDTVENSVPVLTYYDPDQKPPVVLLNNSRAFQVLRAPRSRQPYLITYDLPKLYPNKFNQAVEDLQKALLAGDKPALIHNSLVQMQKKPGLTCKTTYTCDHYYYLLGLSAELAGLKTEAAAAYYRLWWDYSKSPYTTMARFKLKQLVVPTEPATPTRPATLTPTPSLTPTAGTQPAVTPTRTRTPSGSTTVTSAPLPTSTATNATPYGPLETQPNVTPTPYPSQ